MAKEFILPDLGEGIEAGDVVRVLISEGDRIEAEQPILELETDKALIEVPSPFAGEVVSINVKEGDRVPPGTVLIAVEETGAAEAEGAPEEPDLPARPEIVTEPEVPSEPEKTPSPEAAPALLPSPGKEHEAPIPAAPTTRRLARELGVDLRQVTGSGPGGRITSEDVKTYVQETLSVHLAGGNSPDAPPLPDFTRWGEVERQPLRAVRRAIAKNLSIAWNQAPHVTQFDRADVTELEAFRQRHKGAAEALGGKLTPTVLILKAVITALKTFPRFNASLDSAAEELILKRYYHIGIAVDTDRGLLVPVIRDVDRKEIFELAVELTELGERTRNGKADLEELQGGTFTITNLGSIGGADFTPILNFPEVGILGIGRSREEPAVHNGRIEPRLIMPVCLSYDHRVIDGADGARFTRKLVQSLEDPERMLLGG